MVVGLTAVARNPARDLSKLVRCSLMCGTWMMPQNGCPSPSSSLAAATTCARQRQTGSPHTSLDGYPRPTWQMAYNNKRVGHRAHTDPRRRDGTEAPTCLRSLTLG